MGATCIGCNAKTSYIDLCNDMFKDLKLRSNDSGVLMTAFKVAKGKSGRKKIKGISSDEFHKIFEKHIEPKTSEFKEPFKLFFESELHNQDEEIYKFVFAFILLCFKNATNVKQVFTENSSSWIGKNSVKNEEVMTSMKKSVLQKIVGYYVYFVTDLPVNYFAPLSGMQIEFKNMLHDVFSQENRDAYVEDLLKDFDNNNAKKNKEKNLEDDEEWVNLDEFFTTTYPLLNNDIDLRWKILEIYETKRNQRKGK